MGRERERGRERQTDRQTEREEREREREGNCVCVLNSIPDARLCIDISALMCNTLPV